MNEKTLVSAFTLAGSLAFYYYGKAHQKDLVPHVLVGGFVGTLVGEIISSSLNNQTEIIYSHADHNSR